MLTSFPLALEWMDFDPDQPDKRGDLELCVCVLQVMDVNFKVPLYQFHPQMVHHWHICVYINMCVHFN